MARLDATLDDERDFLTHAAQAVLERMGIDAAKVMPHPQLDAGDSVPTTS